MTCESRQTDLGLEPTIVIGAEDSGDVVVFVIMGWGGKDDGRTVGEFLSVFEVDLSVSQAVIVEFDEGVEDMLRVKRLGGAEG